MKLFEYVVIHHPQPTKEDKDAGRKKPSVLLVDVTREMAEDEKEVMIKAAREIPEEYLDRLSQIEVAVRPF